MAIKKRFILLSLLASSLLFQPVFAQMLEQEFPEAYISVIKVFVAPWPIYNFGMLYYAVLMGIVMGFIFYQALSKVFVAEHFGTGGASGIGAALSVIFTLIVLKFMPFVYYYAVTLILIVMAVITSLWILLGSMTHYAGAEGKWKTALTIIVTGFGMLLLSYILYKVGQSFMEFGMLYAKQYPLYAIASVIAALGAIILILGTGYALWTPGFTRSVGGALGLSGAEGVALKHDLDNEYHDLKREFRGLRTEEEIDEKEIEINTDLVEILTTITEELGSDSPNKKKIRKLAIKAKELVNEEIKETKKEIKTLDKIIKEANRIKEEADKAKYEGLKNRIEYEIVEFENLLERQENHMKQLEEYSKILEKNLKTNVLTPLIKKGFATIDKRVLGSHIWKIANKIKEIISKEQAEKLDLEKLEEMVKKFESF